MAFARAVKSLDGRWRFQPLEDHLRGVAERSGLFAKCFGASEVAFVTGLWHDLGKYAEDFQRYLLVANGLDAEREDASEEAAAGRVDHSGAGAVHALDHLGAVGKIVAQLIAAHHHGLYDAEALVQRLQRVRDSGRLAAVERVHPPREVVDQPVPRFPGVPGAGTEPLAYSLWLRLLFSCLVDADVLDSESFCDPEAARLRGEAAQLAELKVLFDQHMAEVAQRSPDRPINAIRRTVLEQCRKAATLKSGLFTLSVPTGGGKTLSSMAFALEHAEQHGFQRVIYVIPYTSIIEQTADVFRSIFGEAVVEHHSNLDSKRETQRSRLASENWDAPIIVTTNVQFFESLFAARTSRCRKLHNILRSVVVLDEAQLLPPDFMQPIVDCLRLLSTHYPVSVVLSTATQPALASRQHFGSAFRGLDSAHEIIADPDALFRQLERVEVHLPSDLSQPESWDTIAERLAQETCVLAIVNRRADARALHERLHEGTVHLSALMCGAHRSDVIKRIRRLLLERREGSAQPLRVVSTQLVEAGVDLDFPVVFRAMAGLDSIAQAAGRCNREGSLSIGRVEVFVPPKPAPAGLLRIGEQACRSVLQGVEAHSLTRTMFKHYFDAFYRDCDLDHHEIVSLLRADNSGGVVGLETAASRFRLIDTLQTGVLVPYRSSADDQRFESLIGLLRKEGPKGFLMRRLQRFVVNLPPWEFEPLRNAGDVEELYPGVWVLVASAQYDDTLGLLPDGKTVVDALVV